MNPLNSLQICIPPILNHLVIFSFYTKNSNKLAIDKQRIFQNIFLGFVNFYQMFIKNYFQIFALFTWLTCKDKLERDQEVFKVLETLKKAFTTAPILIHPNFLKPFFLETYASFFGLGAVLSQPKEEAFNMYSQHVQETFLHVCKSEG